MTAQASPLTRKALDYAPVILLVVLLLASAAIDLRVVAPASFLNIVAQATPIAILAIGAMVVLLTGGIDLSAGVGVAFCAVFMASLIEQGFGLP